MIINVTRVKMKLCLALIVQAMVTVFSQDCGRGISRQLLFLAKHVLAIMNTLVQIETMC